VRRLDVETAVGAAQLASNYVVANGIHLPTKRRAYTRGSDRRPIMEMLTVSIDISEFRFILEQPFPTIWCSIADCVVGNSYVGLLQGARQAGDSDRANARDGEAAPTWIVKRCGPVRDDHHEATLVMAPFRRSPARPFVVQPHHRLGVLPLESP